MTKNEKMAFIKLVHIPESSKAFNSCVWERRQKCTGCYSWQNSQQSKSLWHFGAKTFVKKTKQNKKNNNNPFGKMLLSKATVLYCLRRIVWKLFELSFYEKELRTNVFFGVMWENIITWVWNDIGE